MTTKILLLLTGLAVGAKDCEQADFERPQPDGAKNLKRIPARLQGRYVSLKDSSVLEITDQLMFQHKTSVSSISRNELDSAELVFAGHDTTFYEMNSRIDLKPFGDSIRVKVSSMDTLINISDKRGKEVVRKYRKDYFLNKEKLKQEWDVKRVELNNNELTISSTYAKEDIAFLRKQLNTTDSTLIFNPTKKQFQQFIKEGGFRNHEKFKKQ